MEHILEYISTKDHTFDNGILYIHGYNVINYLIWLYIFIYTNLNGQFNLVPKKSNKQTYPTLVVCSHAESYRIIAPYPSTATYLYVP